MGKKMKKLTMMQYWPRYFSDDILFQILRRLPMKSLLRFTSVSKSWGSCIKSSSFISFHHRHQIANNNNNRTSCSHLVYINDQFQSVRNCTLIPENSKGQARRKVSVPRLRSRTSSVACSCLGLICLRTKFKIHIWNPFIMRQKELPAGKIPLSPSCKLGFGLAPQSGDYRLVKLLFDDRTKHLTDVEIYSLKSDSWRRIKPNYASEGVPFKMYNDYPSPLSFKGSIYWYCDSYDENNDCVYMILRFDLDKEIFEEINVPFPSLHEPHHPHGNLVVANGYLVLLKSLYETMERIRITAYINRPESESESELESELGLGDSSWAAKSYGLINMTTKIIHFWTTPSGHIIVKGGDGKISAYYCNSDGNDWSYEKRDLGIRMEDYNYNYNLIPITETLLLLDEK